MTEHTPEQGYDVPTDVLERLERLVAVVSEPLVAFSAELAQERDAFRARAIQAEATTNRLLKAVQRMVDQWPETSWVTATEARDDAVALLDEIAEGATMGSPEQPPIQETQAHAPAPQRDPNPPAVERPAGGPASG